jgi:hypothetical protein
MPLTKEKKCKQVELLFSIFFSFRMRFLLGANITLGRKLPQQSVVEHGEAPRDQAIADGSPRPRRYAVDSR